MEIPDRRRRAARHPGIIHPRRQHPRRTLDLDIHYLGDGRLARHPKLLGNRHGCIAGRRLGARPLHRQFGDRLRAGSLEGSQHPPHLGIGAAGRVEGLPRHLAASQYGDGRCSSEGARRIHQAEIFLRFVLPNQILAISFELTCHETVDQWVAAQFRIASLARCGRSKMLACDAPGMTASCEFGIAAFVICETGKA